ncbi:tol-pal system protein YbgF [Candidatus Schneideria nysicola]|uniref:tol-pal system protein YbgF n=1 Tax=Candidatus Schneideria nysicola TaxID=1081631 RepID=UPI001CAA529D|nr:tol-pal system protein YbgF [Candidatus Schneideria nysicola]UAJ65611.1 tol-pal system protein YbgF [Candidatus Schneideria nysicola]
MKKIFLFLPFLFFILISWRSAYASHIRMDSVAPPIRHLHIVKSIIEERMDKIEVMAHAHAEMLMQFQQYLSETQSEMNILRNKIEQNQYFLSKIKEDLNSESLSYKKAVSLMHERKYIPAIEALKSFIHDHPHSSYQPMAHYFLGQIYSNIGKKDDALYFFALLAKKYASSPQVPDALLKVGILIQEKGQKDQAKTIYKKIMQFYPNTDSAKKARLQLSQLN